MKHLMKRPEILLAGVYLACFANGLAGALFHIDAGLLLDDLPDLCLFHRLTGYRCPGCGMTHAFLCLGRFEIGEAIRHNVFSIFLFYGGLYSLFFKTRFPFNPSRVQGVVCIGLVVIYGLVRNF